MIIAFTIILGIESLLLNAMILRLVFPYNKISYVYFLM
jgi:hypothetical protein